MVNYQGQGESVGEVVGASASEAWQQMAAEANAERRAEEKARLTKERQQRKIIGYFLSGNNNGYLVEKDVQVDAGMRTEFLDEMNRGRITRRDEEEMLLKLSWPMDQPQRGMGAGAMFGRIAQDAWQLQLLSLVVGEELRGDEQGRAAGASAVVRLVSFQAPGVDYRTPVGFEDKRQEMLTQIRPEVDEVTYKKYEESMDSLEKNLYGKRFEYYQAFEGLRDEAERQRSLEAPTEKLVRRQETRRLSPERSQELMRRAEVDGDAWQQDGYNYYLTPEILAEEGLGPKYVTNVEGREIALSNIYELPKGRVAVEAYIPTEREVKVRSYYRSNSQGMWRYLPDYVPNVQERSVKWFGKGRGEESLNLPYELQESLATIEANVGRRPYSTLKYNPYFLFAGTAKAYSSKDVYKQRLEMGMERMRGDYYAEVAMMPQSTEFGMIGLQKRRPEDVTVFEGSRPDFSQVEARYKTATNLAGPVEVEVFRSQDGQKNWLFCTDEGAELCGRGGS